jgi:hypothetical protein
MLTLAGDTVNFETSLLDSITVVPFAGAGEGRVIGNATERPSPTVTLEGRIIGDALTTVTLAVRSGTPGALARMVAAPGAPPITGTGTLVVNGAKLTDAGTDATVLSLDAR